MEVKYLHQILLRRFGSLAKASKHLGIDRSHLSKMMHGHYKIPKPIEEKIYEIINEHPSNTAGIPDEQIKWVISAK